MKRTERKAAIRAWQTEQAERLRSAAPAPHERWYFVVHHVIPSDRGGEPRFEVQLLDERGRGVEFARFTEPATQVVLGGTTVPLAVLVAAGQLPPGQGCYVDESGWEVTPQGHRLPANEARAQGGGDTG